MFRFLTCFWRNDITLAVYLVFRKKRETHASRLPRSVKYYTFLIVLSHTGSHLLSLDRQAHHE